MEPITIDPDAPWWINTIVVLLAVLVPAFFSWRASRNAKRTHRTLNHEMQPNSGSSMRDAINRIEETQKQQGAQLATLADGQQALTTEVATIYRRHPWWPRHH